MSYENCISERGTRSAKSDSACEEVVEEKGTGGFKELRE
jgi:hypothetical protein